MHKHISLTITLFLCFFLLKAQENKDVHIPLIGESAPSFTAESTQGKIKFPEDYYGKWKILFSHPAAFTAVCTTEILELAELQDDMDKLNTKILVLSADGLNSHLEWIKSMESIRYKGRNPVQVKFPLISDVSLEISRKYGMLHSYSSTTKDVRGVFIVDPDDKIRAIFFYPMNLGRNLDEIKRVITGLQQADKGNVLIPADWQPGQDVLLPSPKTTDDARKMSERKDPDLTEITWYLWFKKIK
jgi:peroxiredoxin 2/4